MFEWRYGLMLTTVDPSTKLLYTSSPVSTAVSWVTIRRCIRM